MSTLYILASVKNTKDRLSFSLFSLISIFFSIYFSFSLFLELRVSVSNNIAWSHISHIRWHGDSDSHKPHNAEKDIEGLERMISYKYV